MIGRRLTLLVTAVLLIQSPGCQKNPYCSVSGTVTYQGKRVPRGEIRFTPDHNRGNQGPAVVARIIDGQYATPDGKGIVGGAYLIRINGYDAPQASNDPTAPDFGQPLFETVVQNADLKAEDQVHDIVIE